MVYLNRVNDVKRYSTEKHYFPRGIIISCDTIVNGYFYKEPIDSDIKLYKEMRKLTGQDYTTGCQLDYDDVKNQYRLIAVDLSSKKIRHWSKTN